METTAIKEQPNLQTCEDDDAIDRLNGCAIEDDDDFMLSNSSERRRLASQSDDDEEFSSFSSSRRLERQISQDSYVSASSSGPPTAYANLAVGGDTKDFARIYNMHNNNTPSAQSNVSELNSIEANNLESTTPGDVFITPELTKNRPPPNKYSDDSPKMPSSYQIRYFYSNSTPNAVLSSVPLSNSNSSTGSNSSTNGMSWTNDVRFAEIYMNGNKRNENGAFSLSSNAAGSGTKPKSDPSAYTRKHEKCLTDPERLEKHKNNSHLNNKHWHNATYNAAATTFNTPASSSADNSSYFPLTYNRFNKFSGKHAFKSPTFPSFRSVAPSDNASDTSSGSSDPSAVFSSTVKQHKWFKYDQDLKHDWNDAKFVDTHCHLDLIFNKLNMAGETADFDYLQYKYEKIAWSPNFAGCIADFCFPEMYRTDNFKLFDRVAKHEKVWLAVGCHPHQANLYDDRLESLIDSKMNIDKVVALGELGLDYSSNNSVDHEIQKSALRKQLKLAVSRQKPILLHCRDAQEDCFTIMKENVPHDYPIHWHCFTNSSDVYKNWSDHFTNLYFGVTLGVFTPRGDHQEQFWQTCRFDRLLIETDAPYFLPYQYRCKELGSLQCSYPGLGALVAVKLAEMRKDTADSVEVPDLLKQIYDNTKTIYKI